MISGPVAVFDTISDLRSNTVSLASVALVYVKGYNSAKGPGGGLLEPATGTDDSVLTFVAGPVSNPTSWRRQLDGGTIDAFMAGAWGDGVLDDSGVVDVSTSTHDDTVAIQTIFDLLIKSAKPPAAPPLRIAPVCKSESAMAHFGSTAH